MNEDTTVTLTIRLSQDLKLRLCQRAEQMQLPPSTYAGQLLERGLESSVHTTGETVHAGSQTLRVGDRVKLRYQPSQRPIADDIWEITAVQGETIQVRLQHSLQPSQETSVSNVERVI